MEKLESFIDELDEKEEYLDELKQPEGIVGLKMREYQLKGFRWLVSRFKIGLRGCFLADDMGLGKTIQTIAFLSHLRSKEDISSPFLIVSPLNITYQWFSEFKDHSPHLKVIQYVGNKDDREDIRRDLVQFVLSQDKSKRDDPAFSFDVIVTSYELLMKDSAFFGKIRWGYLVVDEAQRLKDQKSRLHRLMSQDIRSLHGKLLLTGTPIQNNISELWSLLNFLDPSLFGGKEEFVDTFQDVRTNPKLVQQLHKYLKPFLLRRRKEEVLTSIPKKREITLHCEMTPMQKKYYRWILTRDISLLSPSGGKEPNISVNRNLMNVIVHLRKATDHPYLFDGAEPTFDGEFVLDEHIVDNSGKMLVLDRLLARIKALGRKVLIFSQMTRMLDIIQDYLHLREYAYDRLDGSVRGDERFATVKHFQEAGQRKKSKGNVGDDDLDEEEPFVFLLSTRAGGVGLNLTAADTVILIDSDWNPQSDLQAQARVHRIGQTKEVVCFRLVAQHTVEDVMMKRAQMKLDLAKKVVEEGGFQGLTLKEDRGPLLSTGSADFTPKEGEIPNLTDVLRFGMRIFMDEETSENKSDINISVTDHQIDSLLCGADVGDSLEKPEPELDEGENLYAFEGIDYTNAARKKDIEAMDSLIALVTTKEDQEDQGDQVGDDAMVLRNRKRKSEVLTPEVSAALQEAKLVKKRQREIKKREALESLWDSLHYKSLALPSPSEMDLASGQGRPTEDYDVTSDAEWEEEDLLHFVVGSSVQPESTTSPPHSNAIMVMCVDDFGKWGKGGLFDAILKEDWGTIAKDAYVRAKEARDLLQGSAHLVKVSERGNKSLFLVLCVVQKRTKGSGLVSGISIPMLTRSLTAIGKEARKLNATVHVPRIGYGTPRFNWYSVERTIRSCLSSTGVPTYVYYYRRKGHPLHGAQYSLFKGVNAFLFNLAGHQVKLLASQLGTRGGLISRDYSDHVSHLVANDYDKDNPLLRSLYLRSKGVLHIVSPLWIKDSISASLQLPCHAYSLIEENE